MGKSSTGKDTVYKQLLKNPFLQLKKIVPYTTRPIRAGETEGEEYFFGEKFGGMKKKQYLCIASSG